MSGAFPNVGVSLQLLARILADPRLGRPMHSLPLVGPDGRLTTPLTDPDLEDLGLPRLLALAKAYRVFSRMDGDAEFKQYDGSTPCPRTELLAGLREPPSTTTQVNLCIVKPDTLAAECSYADMLVARGDGEGNVGAPTIFLSHAWRFNFRENVAALNERCGAVPKAERLAIRVWNDIFVEDQNSSDAKPPDYFFTAFKDAVAGIGHTVLVLTPWDDPIPITRAWCLWEIYSTLVVPGATFEVVVSKAEVARLRAAVLAQGDGAVTDAMLDIDAQKAECFVPADRVQIFAAVEAMDGGFHPLGSSTLRSRLGCGAGSSMRSGACATMKTGPTTRSSAQNCSTRQARCWRRPATTPAHWCGIRRR